MLIFAECCVLFSVGLLTGVAGGGAGLIILVLGTVFVGPEKATMFATIVMLIAQGCSAIRLRQSIRWDIVRWYAPISVPSIFAGTATMKPLPILVFQRLIGTVCILFAAVRCSGWESAVPKRRWLLFSQIAVSSYLGAVVKGAGLLGRSAILSSLEKDQEVFVATSAMIGTFQNIAQLCLFWYFSFEWPQPFDIGLTVACTPIGVFVGHAILPKISKKKFEYVQVGIIFLGGIYLLISSFFL